MTSLSELFTRRQGAADAHLAQIKFTDARIEAGEITEEIWQLQFDACDVEDAVVLEICSYRPSSPAEMDQKARFLLDWTKDTQMEPSEASALLNSMLIEEMAGNRPTINDLISAHAVAQAAWDAVKHLETPPAEAIFEAKDAAEHAVIVFPCVTIEDVRRKAEFILNDPIAYDSVEQCQVDGVGVLRLLLQSLAGMKEDRT